MIDAYPLNWPPGWRRSTQRTRAKFIGKAGRMTKDPYSGQPSWDARKPLTIEQAVQRVRTELRRFGYTEHSVVISSNLKLRKDGYPLSGQAQPQDPGASVYWKVTRTMGKSETRCMAIDRYDRVQDNLAAIAATLEAMRAIERHGGATILDRAFTGFTALPAPEQWFQVLGVKHDASREEIRAAHRAKALEHHPDRGGDSDYMSRINIARDQGLEGI
jgi:hypothetical protein